jgi:hypothetical protein
MVQTRLQDHEKRVGMEVSLGIYILPGVNILATNEVITPSRHHEVLSRRRHW